MSLGGWMAHSPDDIPGTFATLVGNDATANVTLPFTFTVEGTDYTLITLSTNGWIEFGGNTAPNSDPSNDCLPTGAHSNPFLAIYWDDLNPFGTQIRHGTVGSSPNRVFIADFEVDLTSGVEGEDDLRFQVQLHEGSNTITVRYRQSQNEANGQSATIGFQGAGGGSATTVEPLVCNGKILDDNRPDEGWSADVGRAGKVTLAAMTAHSPDDISGFTALVGNDAVTNVALPFDVTIEGASYSSVGISTNGWLEFGGNTAGNSDPSNDCLPSGVHSNPLLAAYWDDLNPFGTQIRYGTVGASPNRVFIVDYEADLNVGEGSDDLRFQVLVHERSSLINVRYRDKEVNANGQNATIGFQGAGGASSKAYGLTCNGKILDDNDESKDGWSIHPKASGAMSPHGVLAFSPDDINGTTIPGVQSFSGDDVVQLATMPFSISIDGASYTTVALSTNGWLEFGGNTQGTSHPANGCLPTGTHTNPFLAAFWDDMRTAGSSTIRYGTVGASPNQTFLVDYFLDTVSSGDDGNDDVEIQVQIHQQSNAIIVKYREAQLLANGQTATIGFQSAGGAAATAMPIGCNAKVLDDNVNDSGWSVAPLPICGNGIVEALGDEQCDVGAGNGAASTCCTSACQYRAGGQVCRPGGGPPCDFDESCTGSGAACPADDAPGNSGITCRLGSGDPCDPDELCDGSPGVACPPDDVTAFGTQCRIGSGDICDPAEHCTGVAGAPCPSNQINGASTTCRPGAGDACDGAEVCSGVPLAPCPPDDAPINLGTVCRPGSGDFCDVNETCTGVSGALCPPDDAPGKAGATCRVGSSGDFCDENEQCTGAPGATCPPDDAPGKVNVVCRPGSGDLCDPDERCTGIGGQGCPPNVVANPTTVCRAGSGDACDPDETCTAVPGAPCPADVVTPAGTVCRAAADGCDVAEQCGGITGASCPTDDFASAGTACDEDADVCTVDECDGDGACVFASPLDCDDGNVCTQDSCDPIDGCQLSGAPSTSCAPASKAVLGFKDSDDPARDKVRFLWMGGPSLVDDMGDPTQTTRYELCIYDNRGVQLAMGVAPGANWEMSGSPSNPSGFKYKDPAAANQGIKIIKTKGSNLDKAKVKLLAKGAAIPDDAMLSFQFPVTAQLYAVGGMCWEAEFEQANAKKNDGGGFTGKTP